MQLLVDFLVGTVKMAIYILLSVVNAITGD